MVKRIKVVAAVAPAIAGQFGPKQDRVSLPLDESDLLPLKYIGADIVAA